MAYLRGDRSTLSAKRTHAEALEEVSYIIPGRLQPAVAGKLLDGSTSHSGAYGTAQADGFSYYYTTIKGSQAIKDPRIGAHFGSQRHKFKSLQVLEQETACLVGDGNTHRVYSIDGRRWCRAVGKNWSVPYTSYATHALQNDECNDGTTQYIEVTGYFNKMNHLDYGNPTYGKIKLIAVDGASDSTTQNNFGADNVLQGRYVDCGSLNEVKLAALPLGIHTVQLGFVNNTVSFGIELIAHGSFTDATCDTNHTSGLGSPASTSKITMDSTTKVVAGMSVTGTGIAAGTTVSSVDSATVLTLSAATTATNSNQTFTFGIEDLSIPAQNVVSYGKKYTIAAVAHHYDPFNGFTNSTTLHSAVVDTATSLGLSSAPGASASWAISGTNNIRPYNGGRVVKWVDSNGIIKTSVNMMPPNAQNISTTAFAEIATPSATNVSLPAFSNDAVDHSQAEVAKIFYWREFGNGSANQTGGSGGTYADASTLNGTADHIAFVMDDGLTSLSGVGVRQTGINLYVNPDTAKVYIAFIGTGISIKLGGEGTHGGSDHFEYFVDGLEIEDLTSGDAFGANPHWAQNLPYGTHTAVLSGIDTDSVGENIWEITFHQPKMPPIPKEAVVIADYMLMADFVAAGATSSVLHISKGVRRSQGSRDWFLKTHNGYAMGISADEAFMARGGLAGYGLGNGSAGLETSLPYFGKDAVFENHPHANRMSSIALAGSTQSLVTNKHIHISESTMGMQDATIDGDQSGNYAGIGAIDVHSPIHTSSHYQTFESPYLHELVGGGREMEQTNLVVTADGKTWDEVTRNTSYLGSASFSGNSEGSPNSSTSTKTILDEFRGIHNYAGYSFNKHFAIAYDELICLEDGQYHFAVHSQSVNTDFVLYVDNVIREYFHDTATNSAAGLELTMNIKRGMRVYFKGCWNTNRQYQQFIIHKL